MRKIQVFMFMLCISSVIFGREYHVSTKGSDGNKGTEEAPFQTISRAAQAAYAGDIITVHAGTYREWINPPRGGESEDKRIVYRAAPGERVEIKGSERVADWQKEANGVWKVTLPKSFFGDYNPYTDLIYGDWFDNYGRIHHTGEVFLNNKSLYEKETKDKVLNPVANEKIKDSEGSTYTWYCEDDGANITIWANFHQYNPNKELTEISTRRTCFYPEKPGINYITIDGFHISQAATQWGAPTAEQIGMIATHWNKGWVIENNVISNSKCSGITLGKEWGTGHNVWLANPEKDGSLHYIEVTFNTLRNGWNKGNIGSHIVRNNTISDCEQTGICGSMGGAFSWIYNNHIYNIWSKRQFSGAEIGGIKLHAAIDTRLEKNRIHDTGRGLWLDWMTQGTRVSGNLMYANDLEDIFLEVNHGPYLVDNNVLLSKRSISEQSEGGAFVHNLIAGEILSWPEPNRFTPYHLPHSTEVVGLATIIAGDDRFYNNLIAGRPEEDTKKYGLCVYNGAAPIYTGGNVYYQKAKAYEKETGFYENTTFSPAITLEEKDGNIYLSMLVDEGLYKQKNSLITTKTLGETSISKAIFDNWDGSFLEIDTDYMGSKRNPAAPLSGPFQDIKGEKIYLKVW